MTQRAKKGDWPAGGGDFVIVTDDEDEVPMFLVWKGRFGADAERIALGLIDLINGVAGGGSAPESLPVATDPPLPPGVTPNPQTYTLAAGVALNEDGWEYDSGIDWVSCVGEDAVNHLRTIRRVEAPPQPATEGVSWGVELIGRSIEGQAEPINFIGSHRAYGYCGTQVVWFSRCPEDADVTVLRDGTRPDTDRRQG